MDFLTFLKDYENEDVSAVKGIYESNKAKETAIIKEAFNSEFPSKKEAIFNLKNYFVEEATAPKTIDASYAKDNLSDIRSKIEQLDEGDIRIIIHNHEDSKSDAGVGFEEEAKKTKGKKRGRPAKAPVPVNTGVVYDEPETIVAPEIDLEPVGDIGGGDIGGGMMGDGDEDITDADSEIKPIDDVVTDKETNLDDVPGEDDVVVDVDAVDVGDEDILTRALGKINDEDEDITDEDSEPENILDVPGEPTKLRWSDIASKLTDDEDESVEDDKDGLVGQLNDLDLDDDELKLATEMAESGEIVEDDSKVSTAATLINQINKS